MDESFQDLEIELRALTPCPLRPELLDRAEKVMGAPLIETGSAQSPRVDFPVRHRAWRWLVFGTVGFAAMVAVVAVRRFSRDEASAYPTTNDAIAARASHPVSADSYQPVAASNVLYEMKDEGPATAKNEGAERRVRYRYVDTYTWKNPRNNASLTWSVPRDEIRLQPAQFN